MMRRIFIFIGMILGVINVPAKVVLSSLFTDNMVLQQQTEVQIWGVASSGETVFICPSWDKKTYTARTDATGAWRVKLQTPVAGGPYSIRFSERETGLNEEETLTLHDILIGEVWFCAGQSNMEMPLKGKANQPMKRS